MDEIMVEVTDEQVVDEQGSDEQAGDRLPYRLLTGSDDRAFCEKVSAALDDGYVLHGSPAVAMVGTHVLTAQAVVLPDHPGRG